MRPLGFFPNLGMDELGGLSGDWVGQHFSAWLVRQIDRWGGELFALDDMVVGCILVWYSSDRRR